MSARENLKSTAYFQYAISDSIDDINKLKGYIESKDERISDWSKIFSRLYSQQLRLILLKYSIGDSLDDIKSIFIETLENFIKAENDVNSKHEKFKDYIGIYEDSLKIISLAILFNLENSKLIEVKKIIDSMKGKDKLIDKLVTKKTNSEESNSQLIYPKIYMPLLDVFDESNKAETIQKYLDGWYKSMKSTSWYNSHIKSEIGKASAFYGYWAIEAAAVTYVLEIDDTSYKKMPYYPTDLVDYARSSKK